MYAQTQAAGTGTIVQPREHATPLQITQYLDAVKGEFEAVVRECNMYKMQKEELERKGLSTPRSV